MGEKKWILPRGEVGVYLPPGFLDFSFYERDLFLEGNVDRMGFWMLSEFFELFLQFDDRLLEIELMFHACPV